MTPEEKYHWIDQYLNGDLQGEELDVFRIKMKNDSDLAYDVHVQELIRKQLTEERRVELKQLLSEHAKVEYYGNIWDKKWLYASAAIMVVFVAAFFIIEYFVKPTQQPDPQIPVVKKQTEISAPDNPIPPNSDTTIDSALLDIDQTQPLLVMEETETDIMPEAADQIVESDELSEVLDAPAVESIDIEDKDVRKDEKVTEKAFDLQVISMAAVAPTEDAAEQENKGLLGRRKKAEKESTAQEELTQITTASLKVEYWTSPVNFTGYKLKNKTLILYGVDPNEQVSFKQFENQLFMKRNGSWFSLFPNSTGNKFLRTSDSEVLKILNQ
jgi:hypothetical protein